MKCQILAALACAAMVGSLAIVDAAYAADIKKFPGTRDQVRNACKANGGTLVEGGDHTWCGKGGNGVVCDDTNTCWGTQPQSRGTITKLQLVPKNMRMFFAQ